MTTTPYADSHDYARIQGLPDSFGYDERIRIDAGLLSAQVDTIAPLLLGQTYDPTNADTAEALTRMVVAQFAYNEETGDTTGAAGLFNSTSVGTVHLSRAAAAQGTTLSRVDQLLAPKVLQIARGAGLASAIVGSW